MFVRSMKSLLVVATALAAATAFAGEPRHYGRGHHDDDHDRDRGQPGFRFRIGLLEPRGESPFWDEAFRGFTGDVQGLEDPSFGGEFTYGLADTAEIWAGLGTSRGELRSHYRDFTDGDGNEIRHKKTLDVVPLTVGVTFFPVGHRHTFAPYLGAGGGFYYWRYREAGDFIDFTTETNEIFRGSSESDGTTLGYYVTAGVEARVTRELSLYAEGRWSRAQDDPDDGDFIDFGKIDLDAREVAVGLAWRF